MTGERRPPAEPDRLPADLTPPEGLSPVGGVAGLLPDASELTPWQQYVLLLRRLDAERAGEEARTAAQREAGRSLGGELERLGPEVVEQGGDLQELAVRLGLRRPRLTASPPAADTDLDPVALTAAAAAAVRRADADAARALAAGQRAAFLPGWRPAARNLVIYLAWALAGVVVQLGLVQDSNASPLPALVVVPVVTFLGGLFTVGAAGRVRLSAHKPERSARMGALICFGLFPLGLLVVILRGVFGGH